VPEAEAREQAAAACRSGGGSYIAAADAVRSLGGGAMSVTLPGADWCEFARGADGAMFLQFGHIVALRTQGRAPTPSERAQSFFLGASRPDASEAPATVPRDLRGLRAALEAEARPGAPRQPGTRYMAWEDGARFRVVTAEVGAPLPGSPCVPARLVHEERDNPRFPPGTVLRLTWNARYCLLPAGARSPGLAVLQASERRLAEDPAADAASAARADLAERFFASFRAGTPR
jgi:hypothetical protein